MLIQFQNRLFWC